MIVDPGFVVAGLTTTEKHYATQLVERFLADREHPWITLGDLDPELAERDREKNKRARMRLTRFCDRFHRIFDRAVIDDSGVPIEFSGPPPSIVAAARIFLRERSRIVLPTFNGISLKRAACARVAIPFLAPPDGSIELRIVAIRLTSDSWRFDGKNAHYAQWLADEFPPTHVVVSSANDTILSPPDKLPGKFNSMAWGLSSAFLHSPVGSRGRRGQVLQLMLERVNFVDIQVCRERRRKPVPWSKTSTLEEWLENTKQGGTFVPPLMGVYVAVCVWVNDRMVVSYSASEKHWTVSAGGLATSQRPEDNMKLPDLEEQARRVVFRKLGLLVTREEIKWVGVCLNREDGACVLIAMVDSKLSSSKFLEVYARRPLRHDIPHLALVADSRLLTYMLESPASTPVSDSPLNTSVVKSLAGLGIPESREPQRQWRFFDTALATTLCARGLGHPC